MNEVQSRELHLLTPPPSLELCLQSVANDMKASSKVNGHSFRLFTPLLSKQPKPTERGRAGRRRQRIEKKLLILQEEDEAAKKVDVEVDPAQYDMLTFAEKWFNNHPKDITGLGTFTMRRKRFSRQARKVL